MYPILIYIYKRGYDLWNIFFWTEKVLVTCQTMIKQGGIRAKTEDGDVVLCEKAVAKDILDYAWLLSEDVLRLLKVFLSFLN